MNSIKKFSRGGGTEGESGRKRSKEVVSVLVSLLETFLSCFSFEGEGEILGRELGRGGGAGRGRGGVIGESVDIDVLEEGLYGFDFGFELVDCCCFVGERGLVGR